MSSVRCVVSILAGVVVLSGRPPLVVNQVLNNYSYLRPGLPNYGAAQAAIFTVLGSNMAATTVSQSAPIQYELGGVNVR